MATYNKQFEPTVIRRHMRAASAPLHYALAARWTRGRAAAQLRRYAARVTGVPRLKSIGPGAFHDRFGVSTHAHKCQQLSERAFKLARPLLPAKAAEDIRALIYDHNEWGLGIEVLVDLLIEEQIVVSSVQKHAIVVAMEVMGLERHQSEIAVSS